MGPREGFREFRHTPRQPLPIRSKINGTYPPRPSPEAQSIMSRSRSRSPPPPPPPPPTPPPPIPEGRDRCRHRCRGFAHLGQIDPALPVRQRAPGPRCAFRRGSPFVLKYVLFLGCPRPSFRVIWTRPWVPVQDIRMGIYARPATASSGKGAPTDFDGCFSSACEASSFVATNDFICNSVGWARLLPAQVFSGQGCCLATVLQRM